jgi:hypothetical protein
MTSWLNKITTNPIDRKTITVTDEHLEIVFKTLEHYENEYEDFKKEINVKGQKIFSTASKIPGLAETVYARYSELEAIVDYMELIKGQIIQKYRVHFTEHYNRELQANTVEKYISNQQEVVDYSELVIRMNLIFSKWKGISKGVENLHFQMTNLIKTREIGIEDSTI